MNMTFDLNYKFGVLKYNIFMSQYNPLTFISLFWTSTLYSLHKTTKQKENTKNMFPTIF